MIKGPIIIGAVSETLRQHRIFAEGVRFSTMGARESF